ncbi:unnamed protein product [Oikopleura dioica]|uniref:Uncharacterized protein n=1 Tax=Oikopleura dioica TaxID=34765 RepID=E4XCI1_OIKDI|nr:unnamed protein product [Oikopleura dioica]
MTMEDEMTEYPETECEAENGPQPMGGLFSGKGAAKAQKMFLARKARMAKYSSVSYGENTEHPDLEHLNKSDEESSDEDEDENQQVLNHDGHIEAYEVENLERIRKKKCAKVEQKLETTGKGMNLFQKRQQHVQKYIVDQPNENYEKDANHSHLQNGNSVNNGVSEKNGNYSPSPMFSVNLKHVAGNNKSLDGAENGHQNREALSTTMPMLC